ncbi:hypothetical protein STANM309S_03309 [Streptomyces tanashiensis]
MQRLDNFSALSTPWPSTDSRMDAYATANFERSVGASEGRSGSPPVGSPPTVRPDRSPRPHRKWCCRASVHLPVHDRQERGRRDRALPRLRPRSRGHLGHLRHRFHRRHPGADPQGPRRHPGGAPRGDVGELRPQPQPEHRARPRPGRLSAAPRRRPRPAAGGPAARRRRAARRRVHDPPPGNRRVPHQTPGQRRSAVAVRGRHPRVPDGRPGPRPGEPRRPRHRGPRRLAARATTSSSATPAS